jgi:hypothetical protein
MFTKTQCDILINYIKSKIDNLYDSSQLVIEDKSLATFSNMIHKGFYIGMVDAKDEDIVKKGLLQENLTNIVSSADTASQMVYDYLKLQNIPRSKVQTSTFYITIILDVQYVANPMSWDETKDGVYFMWGQDFKGFYLPYEIQRMNLSKIEVLDKLCSDVKIPSSLWKIPEGLCWALKCFSIKS